MMQCPRCNSTHIVKNGWRTGKQNYLCRTCCRQFIDTYEPKGYSPEVKVHCLMLYLNGRGFRAIEPTTGVCHNSVINWVKQADQQLPKDENYEIPETTQLGHLSVLSIAHLGHRQTFVGSKKQGLAVDSCQFSPSGVAQTEDDRIKLLDPSRLFLGNFG